MVQLFKQVKYTFSNLHTQTSLHIRLYQLNYHKDTDLTPVRKPAFAILANNPCRS